MENNIIIKFSEDLFVTLSSDNPNIGELMNCIVENKDKIDLEKLEVQCPFEDFDKEGFKQILKYSLASFCKDLTFNKAELDEILKNAEDDEF